MLVAVFMLFLLAAPGQAAELTIEPVRMVKISGTMTDSRSLEWATEVTRLAGSPGPITLVINSGGGSVTGGLMLIDLLNNLRANGAVINCIVPVYANSMAFFLLTACSNRYAFPNASLLWHDIRFFARQALTERTLTESLDGVRRSNLIVREMVLDSTNMSEAFYSRHAAAETDWPAQLLADQLGGWLSIVDSVKGTTDLLDLFGPLLLPGFGQYDLQPSEGIVCERVR